MKIEDFAYSVAQRTLDLMEELHHYKISAEHRKEIATKITKEVPGLMKKTT